MSMELPPLLDESKCALVDLHRHIYHIGMEKQQIDPKVLLKMVTKYAKRDGIFANNPQQAILQTISDLTASHLYTRP
eukprot:12413010-Karenia_brevis.AAC.1